MSINVIDTIKPKNSSFPVAEAIDIAVEGYPNLAEAVTHFATDEIIAAINAILSGKANTADVATSLQNLQGQIDNIITPATEDAEVQNARIGADGTSYTTLKARLDAEYGALTDEQTNLKSDLDELIGKKPVSFTGANGYIGVNPDGSPKIVSSEQFEISEPIRVLKDEIIRFNAVGYSTAVVMICECTAGGSLQRVLVKSTDSTLTTYTYTAEWDMYIKVSYDKRKTHTLDILTEKSNDFMSNYINTKAFGSSGLNITSSSFNLDNCEPNKIYTISVKCTNIPSIENGGICFTTARYNNSIDTYAQTFIGLGGNLYTRFKAYGGTWTEWKSAVNALIGSETNINDSTFDLDDCSPNKVYLISQQCVHAPAIGICYILAHKSNAVDTYCQMFVTTSGICYTRFKAYGGTWTEWKRHSNDSINTFAKLSLFDTVGVVGDSYASGEIYATDGTLIGDKYKISWIQQLARRNGFVAHNFSVGGLSTRTWLTSTHGLSKLNSTEACDLYILALGINDFYSIGINYIGNESDMASATADTFYGNYAKIINAIKAKAPNSKLMIANIAIRITADASNKTVIKAFNEAIVNISEYFEIPLIDQCNYEYFQSAEYQNNMYHGHPTAVGYSAMATALENCISMSMIENKAYFENADFD
jgi:lysophospholipase L1-like esterase